MELQEFLDSNIPEYAILSHTWSQGEVTFHDFETLPDGRQQLRSEAAKRKEGYSKIAGTCAQAAKDGLSDVWVGTCCIDKSSSAELSEAINSSVVRPIGEMLCLPIRHARGLF